MSSVWSFFEQLMVQSAVTALKLATHNPATLKKEASIISQIAVAATAADALANGTVWTSTPGVPPAA